MIKIQKYLPVKFSNFQEFNHYWETGEVWNQDCLTMNSSVMHIGDMKPLRILITMAYTLTSSLMNSWSRSFLIWLPELCAIVFCRSADCGEFVYNFLNKTENCAWIFNKTETLFTIWKTEKLGGKFKLPKFKLRKNKKNSRILRIL